MGWADRMAGRSSHPSAQNYLAKKGVEGASIRSPQEVVKDHRAAAAQGWGVRYGHEVGELGVRQFNDTAEAEYGTVDFGELNSLKPGTPEFTRRYIPPPESCETIAPHGAEGFAVISRDDVPLETPEPVRLTGGASLSREEYEAMNGR